MTLIFQLPPKTQGVKGSRNNFLATAGAEKEGMTDYFWGFAARVDGQSGGELMKPITIVKGTTVTVLYNVMKEMVAANADLVRLLKVNSRARPIWRGATCKVKGHEKGCVCKKKDMAIPLEAYENWSFAERAEPDAKWLNNFVFTIPITAAAGSRIGSHGIYKGERGEKLKGGTFELPYIVFKDGQVVTVSKKGWNRGETEMLMRRVYTAEVVRRRKILRERGWMTLGGKRAKVEAWDVLYALNCNDNYGV